MRERAVVDGEHLLCVAETVSAALRPYAGADWSVQAGSLEWDVDRTVTHMIGACAKYTLYLASGSSSCIPLVCARTAGSSQRELIDSIIPVATGLTRLSNWVPPSQLSFHSDELIPTADYLAIACEELLVHTHDAVAGLGGDFTPPEELPRPLVDPVAAESAWTQLLTRFGRLA